MARFNYKLQSVLDIKQKLESQEKIAYGLAAAKLAAEQDQLKDLVIQRGGYELRARELVNGTIQLGEITMCRNAIEAMKYRIKDQVMEVHKADKELEIVRKRLNEIMIERKTYEKLREKKFEEFKQEVAYEENKAVDELVSYTYHQDE